VGEVDPVAEVRNQGSGARAIGDHVAVGEADHGPLRQRQRLDPGADLKHQLGKRGAEGGDPLLEFDDLCQVVDRKSFHGLRDPISEW
jgi:hypothetical protein